MFNTIEDATWSVVGDYINSVSQVAHQLESYDHFIENQLPYIIGEGSDISYMHSSGKVSHHVHFTNPSVNRPAIQESDGFYKPITPHIARLRGLTYSSTVVVDVIHDRINHTVSPPTLINRKVFRNVIIAQIPVMVRSKLCYLSDVSENELSADAKKHECKVDPGGYFIISGNEKTLIPQTKIRTNHVFIFPSKHGEKHKYTAEVRSCHEAKLRSTSTIYMQINDISNGEVPVITCKLPFLKSSLSVFVLFRMLGAENTDDIINYIGNIPKNTEAILRIMLDSDTKQNYSRDAIMDWVGRNVTSDTTRATKESREKYVDHIITSELVPHMGLTNNPETNKKKMIFIGHMIQRLMTVATGHEVVDDRDDFINKRIDSAGALLALLLRQHHRGNAMQGLSTQLRKQVESPRESTFNVGEIVSHKKITSGLKFAFATGTWGISRGGGTANGGQTGVVQILPRLTTMATLGSSRKINTPIAREGRTAGPRMLHPSSWGLICCSDTPEGQACGLVSNLAMTTRIRIGAPMQPIAKLLISIENTIDISSATTHERYIGYALHVNGTIVGYAITVEHIKEIATQMRSLRRRGNLPFDCSVSISNYNCLFVNSDHGALLRPLIIRDRYHDFVQIAMQDPAIVPNKYTRMLRDGIIEYIDSAEQTNMRVAIHHTDIEQDEYTHIEIHPALLTGICVSQIPFCDHNQSPRIAYQAAQCKQAIGLYTTNFAERLDTVGHVLATPQKPLVTTRLEELLGTSVVRSGAVPIVAIMCYSGFNQDDSVLLNQSSIDRGLFASFAYHTIRDEEKGTGADIERFENPKKIQGCGGLKEADYSKIDDNGLPIIGKTFYNGDVIIGKVVSMSLLQADPTEGEVRRDSKRDRSHVLKTDEPVVVDAVFLSKTPEGHGYVKVRTRAVRIPMVGDKFSSRHGQKGVCGVTMPAADFPCTPDGIVPDIIINPHAIPSRMTIGMLMEMVLSKVACYEGETQDGTPFTGNNIELIADRLEAHGMQRYGNEMLYNGMTGEMLDSMIFIAPCYYQRLKHMVVDKSHARNRGALQLLTRAPAEGRSREGGLRIGEMEKDSIISHGAGDVAKDRLFEQSDIFECVACEKCGHFARDGVDDTSIKNSGMWCENCKTGEHCTHIQLPYSMKLLIQELAAAHISATLEF
tara:strand:- start:3761 stop:7231 length:3471 start_codon:yes stop_codon:yes gene_type:complete